MAFAAPKAAARQLSRAWKYRAVPRLAWTLGFTRGTRQIVSAWPEEAVPLGPRVAIFCHFDRRGEVREHVLHYVSGLGRAGFEIVFVTNSGRLRPDAQERLRALCAAILVRRNIGYDF